MNICVIPARGGSKRIPRKNIKVFHGKPMIAWSIETALNSGCFDEVWVSTDDEEIASIAKAFGSKVPFIRPLQLSDDYATTADVMEHAVQMMDAKCPKQLNYVCCLYATAPFVQISDLHMGLKLIQENSLDFVFSATTYAFPIQRAIKINSEGNVEMFSPEYFNCRSQDLEEAWHDAGQFYWGTSQAWLDRLPIFSSRSKIVALPRYRVQDIDTQEDWERAELMAHSLLGVQV